VGLPWRSAFCLARYDEWEFLVGHHGARRHAAAHSRQARRSEVARTDILVRFEKDAVEPVGSSPAEFRAQVGREIAQWRDLAKQTDLKVE